MNTRMIRVNEKTHRLLKGLAGLNGMTLADMLEKMVSFWTEKNQSADDCKLCRKYGLEPNAETIKAFEETDKGIGLSETMSGKDALAMYDKEFGGK